MTAPMGTGRRLVRWTVLAVTGVYLLLPLLSMLEFSTRGVGGRRSLDAWRDIGGSTWDYWRHVGVPILTPPFLGATLLLFANAFSAYATAAALVSQGSPIVPLQIRTALTSEVILGQANVGKALALGMIVVIAVVMTAYALLQRRTSRWLR